MTKLDLLRDWFRRVWVEGEVAATAEYFAPGAPTGGVISGTAIAPQDFADLVPALRQHLLHPEIAILRHIEADDCLWALVEVRAQSVRDLAPVRCDGQVTVRITGGRIAEAYAHLDLVALFEGLGFLPPDTLALCLTGERIG